MAAATGSKKKPGFLSNLSGTFAKIPVLKRFIKEPAHEEPFHAIEDSTATSDHALLPNAAPSAKKSAPSLDFGSLAASLVKNRFIVIIGGAFAVLIVLAAVTSILVAAPPEKPAPPPVLSPEGAALVRKLILPPDPITGLEYELERPLRPEYTEEELQSLRPRFSPEEIKRMIETLAARNDAAAAELFATAP